MLVIAHQSILVVELRRAEKGGREVSELNKTVNKKNTMHTKNRKPCVTDGTTVCFEVACWVLWESTNIFFL